MLLKMSLFIAAFSSIFFISCTSIQQTIYLQDVEVNGPMNPPPIHLTKNKLPGSVTISPRLSFNRYSEISGSIGSGRYGDSSQDSIFRSRTDNLFWKLPQAAFGVDFDFAVSNSFALAGGLNYSIVDQTKLFGGSLGFGFFKEKDGHAIRFDAGVLIQELYYDAKTVVVTTVEDPFSSPTTSVYYYHDRDKNSGIDLYAMLTYNTVIKDLPFNFFLNVAYFNQTILDFEPKKQTDLSYLLLLTEKTVQDTRGEATSSFLSLTPGITLEFNDWSWLVLGARIMHDIGLKRASENFFILPVVQLDMQF